MSDVEHLFMCFLAKKKKSEVKFLNIIYYYFFQMTIKFLGCKCLLYNLEILVLCKYLFWPGVRSENTETLRVL